MIVRIIQPFDMRIDANGRWFHDGQEIRRRPLVKLFASVLMCDEAGKHWIRTPVEQAAVVVEDVPLLITVLYDAHPDTGIAGFQTNLDDFWQVTEDTRIEMRLYEDTFLPYVLGERGLWARLDRQAWVDFAHRLTEQDDQMIVALGGMDIALQIPADGAGTC